jgi:hypothetical protein
VKKVVEHKMRREIEMYWKEKMVHWDAMMSSKLGKLDVCRMPSNMGWREYHPSTITALDCELYDIGIVFFLWAWIQLSYILQHVDGDKMYDRQEMLPEYV